jgi:hypothetical protein
MGHLGLVERKTFLLEFMEMMTVLLVLCCCGDQMTEHVADGETQDCVKGEMILDCFDFCVSSYSQHIVLKCQSCLNTVRICSDKQFWDMFLK